MSGEAFHPLRILIVEDTRERQQILTSLYRSHAWVMVSTAARAQLLLQAYRFDLISLDYNLAGEGTGEVVAQSILATAHDSARIVVHSMNPKGAARLRELLPKATLYPVHKMTCSNAHFRKLQRELDEKSIAFDWGA